VNVFILTDEYRLNETPDTKEFRSADYNFNFNKDNGFFSRWGAKAEDDPQSSPFGPEILDLEISINGCPNHCPFCYKGNTNQAPTNMTFDTFKKIIDKMPPTLTQIAFGITGVQTNPDFVKMLVYTRMKGIIPNFTLSGMDLTTDLAVKISMLVGGLAVSVYQSDKNVCYDTVQKFTDLGVKQTNIHLMVSNETLDFAFEVLNDKLNDPRLKKLNAIVFLGVKPKGRGMKYTSLSVDSYERLVRFCLENDITFGFDSCSAPKFEAALSKIDMSLDQKRSMLMSSERCESSLFSAYINTAGEYWNCSFSEKADGVEPVNVLEAEDFVRDVWCSPQVQKFRNNLLSGGRQCPVYPEINDGTKG
jgi:hypothetical protein